MCRSFVTSYVFGAEAIIQHWFWKTLKNATQSFGPLLQVFASDYDATTTCGTDAWESIFTLFPRAGAAITHQLIVIGFEQCMSIQEGRHPLFCFISFIGIYYPLTDIVIVHIVYINETTPPPIPPSIHPRTLPN